MKRVFVKILILCLMGASMLACHKHKKGGNNPDKPENLSYTLGSASVELKWDAVADAARYEVVLLEDAQVTTTTTYTYGNLDAGEYTWKVRAIKEVNSKNYYSNWATGESFTIEEGSLSPLADWFGTWEGGVDSAAVTIMGVIPIDLGNFVPGMDTIRYAVEISELPGSTDSLRMTFVPTGIEFLNIIPPINVPATVDEISTVIQDDSTRVLYEDEEGIDLSTIPFPSMGNPLLDGVISGLQNSKITKVELEDVRVEVSGELVNQTIPYQIKVGGTLVLTANPPIFLLNLLGGIDVEFMVTTELEKQ